MTSVERIEITLPSALFPFTLADLPRFKYGRYRLDNVFRRIEPKQQQECVELWLRNGVAGSPKAAWERSREVCYLLSDAESGHLIGLNTLYPDRLAADSPECFFNRMFIEPTCRNSRLMIVATAATVCYARTNLAGEGVPGIVNVNENPKLGRRAMRRVFERLGYKLQGRQAGHDVWYFEFASVSVVGSTEGDTERTGSVRRDQKI